MLEIILTILALFTPLGVEDDTGPGYWNAAVQGDGCGQSFVQLSHENWAPLGEFIPCVGPAPVPPAVPLAPVGAWVAPVDTVSLPQAVQPQPLEPLTAEPVLEVAPVRSTSVAGLTDLPPDPATAGVSCDASGMCAYFPPPLVEPADASVVFGHPPVVAYAEGG